MKVNRVSVKYLCKSPGCRATVDKRGYCPLHSYKQREDDERKAKWFNNSKYRNEWTELYNSSRWRNEREAYLKENPICVSCGETATVVDHIKAHRGDEELFWDRSNYQSLCVDCHNKKTLQEMLYRRRK